jgi:hypothetical protein
LNLEFGHKQGDIKRETAKKYFNIQGGGMKLKIPSILVGN